MTGRPWRAVAYLSFGSSGRIVLRRTARKTQRRLASWIADAEREGLSVDVWEVRPIPEVEEAAIQHAQSLAG